MEITNAYGSVTSAPATLVVSSATAFGILGAPFGPYQIPATNNPTWYSVSGLPPGLKLRPGLWPGFRDSHSGRDVLGYYGSWKQLGVHVDGYHRIHHR